MRKSTKKKMTVLGIIEVLLAALWVFLVVWFFGAKYPRFESIAKEEFEVPGLTKISAQGICALPENEQGYDFATSGYMVDKTPSRIYLIAKDGASKYITVQEDGKANTSHFGGVTCSENYLFVTSGKRVLRLSLASVLSAGNGSAVEVLDFFRTDINNAYCYYNSGLLYVGEFYREGNYDTQESHHRAVAGGVNYAYVYEFAVDDNKEGGIASTVPQKVLSVREQVQGIAIYEGGITLSTSYGLPDSRIFTYRNILEESASGTVAVGENQVPLYVLDNGNLQSELIAPCMSEEICVKDGRLYVIFESMCDKYRYFTRTRLSNVYSIELSALK